MKKIKILMMVVIIMIMGLGLYFLFYSHYKNNKNSSLDTGSTAGSSNNDKKVDSSPSTSEEQKVADNIKENTATKESGGQTSTQSKNIKPIITYAGQYGSGIEVGAYAPVFEDSGKCKLTLSKGSYYKEVLVNAVKDATTTNCPVMRVELYTLQARGVWKAVVSYESPNYSGISDSRDIEVK